MTLAEYLKMCDLTDIEFAKEIGVSRMTIWNLKNGKFAGNAKTLAKIVKRTDGKVTYGDLIPGAIG